MKLTISLMLTALLLNLTFANGQTASYNLKKWPSGSSPEEIGTRIADKYLASPHTQYGNLQSGEKPTQITYPDACTWLGCLWFADATKNQELFSRLEERFTPLFGEEKKLLPRPDHVDNNVFGSVPLQFYLETRQKKYLDLGLMYADTQWILPDNASPVQQVWAGKGYTWQTRIWIDDMFMITAVQTQAFRATGDRKFIDRAARKMVLYLDEIQLENGLFYHSPDAHFSWGRGNGWMAAGMVEILRTLPKDNTDRLRIMAAYRKMMATLLQHQASDGMWRQVIDDPEFWKAPLMWCAAALLR